MAYFLLFLIEMLLLALLSKRLVYALSALFYSITKSHKAMVNIMAILFLPGTIIHELAHLLSAGMLLVPTGEINLLPEVEGNTVKLGSVQVGKTDLIRRSMIGVAPILLGLFCIFALFIIVPFSLDNLSWWKAWLVLAWQYL